MGRSIRSPERGARSRVSRRFCGVYSETHACLECYGQVMKLISPSAGVARTHLRGSLVALTCAVVMPLLVLSPAAVGDTATVSGAGGATQLVALGGTGAASVEPTLASGRASASATLSQCATATIPQ